MESYTELLKKGSSVESTCSTDATAVIKCATCCSENEYGANWCTECGKAFVDGHLVISGRDCLNQREPNTSRFDLKSKPVAALDDSWLLKIRDRLSRDIKSVSALTLENEETPEYTLDSFHSKNYDYEHLSSSPLALGTNGSQTPAAGHPNTSTGHIYHDSEWSSSRRKFKSSKNSLDHQVMQKATPPEVHLAAVKETSSRHWRTSSHYTWRKPSTLGLKVTNKKQNSVGNLPEPIPLLNLDRIHRVDESLSLTRRQVLCNKNYLSANVTHELVGLLDELLLYVMSFLDQSDLVSCIYVCSRFYFIASDQSLWKHITIRGKSLQDQLLTGITAQYPLIESVTLARCYCTHQGSALKFNSLFKRLPKLKKLKCSICNLGPCGGDAILLSAATNCPELCEVEFDWTTLSYTALATSIGLISRLQKLSLHQHGNLPISVFQSLFSHHRQWLKELDIGGGFLGDVIFTANDMTLSVPLLHSLSVSFSKVDKDAINNLHVVFPALKHLHISTSSFSEEAAAAAVSLLDLNGLHLKLFSDVPLAIDSCKHISQMTSLKELSLDCINDDGLRTLCVGSLSLEKLNLSHSVITSISLPMIGKSSFKLTLKLLKLNGCDKINHISTLHHTRLQQHTETETNWSLAKRENKMEDEFRHIIGSCPQLRVMEVSGVTPSHGLMAAQYGGLKHHCKIIT